MRIGTFSILRELTFAVVKDWFVLLGKEIAFNWNCNMQSLPRTQTSLFDVRAKEGGNGPLRFITSHSRFALASAMRKTKRLRRRLMQS